MKYFFFLSFILILACNNNTPSKQLKIDSVVINPPLKKTVSPDTIVEENTITQKTIIKAKEPNGIYETKLPCKDCKGIRHIIKFAPNHTFQLQEETFEADKKMLGIKGTWKVTDSIIWLYKDQIAVARYKWNKDRLMYMDVKDNKSYALQKMKSAWNNKVWRDKSKKGIAFLGIGNEPFWSVEISKQDSIRFHLAEWSQPISFASVAVINMDSITYKASTDSLNINISIYPRFCNDGMSDYVYDHEIKLKYNDHLYQGCGLLYQERNN
jgi:uncharacterized membrane protein